MGHRPRIAMPNAQQKARTAVRELYSDLIDNLSNNECDLIIRSRMDGLGPVFIVDIVNRKRAAHRAHQDEVEKLWLQKKQLV
jgi:hypothetical protein